MERDMEKDNYSETDNSSQSGNNSYVEEVGTPQPAKNRVPERYKLFNE